MHRSKVVVIFFLLAISLTACSLSLAADVTPPPDFQPPQEQAPATVQTSVPLLPPDIENGQLIYEQKCIDCHGPEGMGDGSKAENLPNPAAPIGDPQFSRTKSPVAWFEVVTNGNIEKFMPGFQSLNDRERWDVTAYALTLSMNFDPTEQELIFDANCGNCHSPGNEFGIVDFLDASYLARLSQSDIESVILNGNTAGMPAFNQRFDARGVQDIAAFVRSLGYRNFSPTVSEQTSNLETPPTVEPETPVEPKTVTPQSFTLVGNIQNLDPIPPGLVIRLSAFDAMSMVFEEDFSVDENGSYRFPDLDVVEGRVYQLATMVDGIEYTSEVLHSPQIDSKGEVNLPIVITSTSTDASPLFAERLHVFFDFIGDNKIQVVQLFVITNPTNQTIVAENGTTPIITYRLPAEAENLQFEQGAIGSRYMQMENGFGDLQPVDANSSTQFLFAYEVPYQNKMDLSFELPLPVQAAVFMLPSNSVEIKSDQLVFDGNRSVQGMDILTYSATNLSDQSILNLQLSGKIKSAQSITGNNMTGTIIGAVVFLVALLLAGYWFFLRKPQVARSETFEEVEDMDSLLDAVIALDDAYKNGELPEQAYHTRRQELTSQIEKIQKKD